MEVVGSMKVAMLGMTGEFDSIDSTAGIVKYQSNLYAELGKIPDVNLSKIEYRKAAQHFPWANHTAFFLESRFFPGWDKYDIIHNPNGIRPFHVSRHKKAKVVTTIHDLMAVTNREMPPSQGENIKGRLIYLNALAANYVATEGFKMAQRDEAIIVLTDGGKEELIKYFGYPSEKIYVIRIAIDWKFINEPIPERKTPNKEFKIGWLSSYNYQKNPLFAIRAVKMLKDPDIKFELWGKKSIEAGLLDSEVASDKRIQFMGQQEQSDKIRVFDSFDVFLHPSEYESLIQFEALSRGLPVIVKKESRLSQDMRDHCFEAEDEAQMAQIIQDLRENGYNKQKRDEAIRWARSFTWTRSATDTINVYKKVLE
jgi:glycosyltransferase involved in cell wall biosynthesis